MSDHENTPPPQEFDDNNDSSDLSEIDEDVANEIPDHLKAYEDIKAHKRADKTETTTRKNIRKQTTYQEVTSPGGVNTTQDIYGDETLEQRKRRLFEERMDAAVKSKGTKRKRKDEDDLEKMQDEKIDIIKEKMIRAAQSDAEKNANKEIASGKLRLLPEVTELLNKADLSISILDNNLLEAVRLWLEPLPDASLPAYEIQNKLINALVQLPIKTDHLQASGIGKVMVFYQRSKRVEPALKRVVENLIADWTRPIMKKSDSYKDKQIRFEDYDRRKHMNAMPKKAKSNVPKTLYEEAAERRKRAAIPSSSTTAYKVAPRVNVNMLQNQGQRYGNNKDERFRRINQRLNAMGIKKKSAKKGGVSIEGKGLAM